MRLRACLKILKGAAARDFGRGQGGEAGASPQRAVTVEPTQAATERPAARRVSAEKALWLRCSSVEDPQGIFSFIAPRHTSFSAKTAPFRIFRQALKIFVVAAVTAFVVVAVAAIMVGCRQAPEHVGAAVDNDSNVLTGGPITGTTLQDLPPPVTETLQQQVPHAKIDLIERKTRDGEPVYEFTFTESSNTPKLYVSEDGKVLPASTKD